MSLRDWLTDSLRSRPGIIFVIYRYALAFRIFFFSPLGGMFALLIELKILSAILRDSLCLSLLESSRPPWLPAIVYPWRGDNGIALYFIKTGDFPFLCVVRLLTIFSFSLMLLFLILIFVLIPINSLFAVV